MKAFARRVSVLSTVLALGLVISPVAAHAGETLSQTGSGWGQDWAAASTAAESDAYWRLHDLAASKAEVCGGISYSNVGLSYIVPGGGGYVFTATATGSCA